MAICKLQKKIWKHIETVVCLVLMGLGGLVIHWWRWGDLVIHWWGWGGGGGWSSTGGGGGTWSSIGGVGGGGPGHP